MRLVLPVIRAHAGRRADRRGAIGLFEAGGRGRQAVEDGRPDAAVAGESGDVGGVLVAQQQEDVQAGGRPPPPPGGKSLLGDFELLAPLQDDLRLVVIHPDGPGHGDLACPGAG